MSSSSSSSSDDDDLFIQQMFGALLNVSETGVGDVDDSGPSALPGGAGTGRPNRKKPRKYKEDAATPALQRRRDHNASPWADRYFNAPLRVGSLSFDTFRQKFRVPYPMFNWILREARASQKFPDELVVKEGRVPAPLSLQIAAALRYLATGSPIDANEEAAGLGRTTMQHFNAGFFEWFNQRFYHEWVTSKIPTDDVNMTRVMKPFSMCGLAGAIASRDGVHIATDRAKSQQRHLMTGKEGYPTWGYDCTVAHTRQFLEVHGPFRGNTNDKTMVRDSPFVKLLRGDPRFTSREYNLFTTEEPPAHVKVWKGVHGINDGGYHKWPETIAGPKPDDASTPILAQFGGVTESMRKDTECSFGIVKKRERILRLPLLVMKKSKVDNIVKTCVIIHNMLLQYDGLDNIGELDEDYLEVDPGTVLEVDVATGELPSDHWLEADIMASDVRLRFTSEEQMVQRLTLTPVTITTDTTSVNYEEQDPSHQAEYVVGYEEKLEALAIHLDRMYNMRIVKWLKTVVDCRPVTSRPPLGCPGPWHNT